VEKEIQDNKKQARKALLYFKTFTVGSKTDSYPNRNFKRWI